MVIITTSALIGIHCAHIRDGLEDEPACGAGMLLFVGKVRALAAFAKAAPVATAMAIRAVLGEAPPDSTLKVCVPST